ncbi:8465_t:CDS:2 [Cetraspora pellucida]|uniref:8465_t:CDS:1 n=1 Tax=Cetraspora pellucida TaxID=1433469 RepID=A0ACA9KRL6_9GLOM|nr:8465_t:CDS:2 [Cetraspora pellucida]
MEESDTEIADNQSVSEQNITDVFSYFKDNDAKTRTKCIVKGCTKDFALPLSELIAKNHISKSHHKEWAALEKIQDKPSTEYRQVYSRTYESMRDIAFTKAKVRWYPREAILIGMKKLPNNKIYEIADSSIGYWLWHWSTAKKYPNWMYGPRNGFINYTHMINDNFENDEKSFNQIFELSKYDAHKSITSIVPHDCTEDALHQTTHHIFRELLKLNNINPENQVDPIDEINQTTEKLNKKQHLKINKILENLNIEFSNKENIDEKIDKIIEFSESLKQF